VKVKNLILSILIASFTSCDPAFNSKSENTQIKRVGMVIKLKEESLAEYKALHAEDHPGVRDLLTKYNLHNFSIFLTQLEDGNYYEFGYYEYTGNDFEEDMKALSREPRNIEWLKICDPMQEPIGDSNGWKDMETIYYNP
jgi:L-rhamnose mutarotase